MKTLCSIKGIIAKFLIIAMILTSNSFFVCANGLNANDNQNNGYEETSESLEKGSETSDGEKEEIANDHQEEDNEEESGEINSENEEEPDETKAGNEELEPEADEAETNVSDEEPEEDETEANDEETKLDETETSEVEAESTETNETEAEEAADDGEFNPTKNVLVEYNTFNELFKSLDDDTRREITKIVFSNTRREDGKKYVIQNMGSYLEDGETIEVALTYYVVGNEIYVYIPEVVTPSLNSLWGAFVDFLGLEEIVGLDMFDTSKVSDASFAFYNCGKLTKIGGIDKIDTRNITNMSFMFEYCSSLTELDLSNFDTSKVTSMEEMFFYCENLRSLNISSFDTSKVTNMYAMFCNLEKLESIDVSNFDVTNVVNMKHMFALCDSLTELDLSNFDTHNVEDMSFMFLLCTKLQKIYVSELWNTSKVTDYEEIFEGSTNLEGEKGTKYDAKCGSDIDYARIDGKDGKKGLLNLKKTGGDLEGETADDGEFNPTKNVLVEYNTFNELFKSLDDDTRREITKIVFSNTRREDGKKYVIQNMGSYLEDGETIEVALTYYVVGNEIHVYIPEVVTPSLNSLWGAFVDFLGLEEIVGLDMFDTSKMTTMKFAFYNCEKLTKIGGLDKLNTENVEDMRYMFAECASLTELDLSNFDTKNVVHMDSMFCACWNLQKIYVSELWNTENVTEYERIFEDATKLEGEKGTKYDAKCGSDIDYARIDGKDGKKGLLNLKKTDGDLEGETDDDGEFNPTNNVSVEYNSLHVTFNQAVDYGFINREEITKIVFTNTKREDGKKFTIPSAGKYVENGKTIDARLTFYLVGSELYVYIPEVVTPSLNTLLAAFMNFTNLEEIVGLDMFDTSNMTDASMAFNGCEKLTKIGGLDKLDTKNVTKMNYMFSGCVSLEELDLSNFDTSKVITMEEMFFNCKNLRSLNVSSFDTSKVINMRGMFGLLEKIESIDLSSFDTTNIVTMKNMFTGCASLTELDLSSFDTRNVADMNHMFWLCTGLQKIYVSNSWSTKNVINYEGIFEGSTNLEGEKGTKYDAKCGSDIDYARIDGKDGKKGLLNLKRSGSELEEVVLTKEMLFDKLPYKREEIIRIDFIKGEVSDNIKKDATKIDIVEGLTAYASSRWIYVEIDENLAVKLPADSSYYFADMNSLNSINGLLNLDTSNVEDMTGMFQNDNNLYDINKTSEKVPSFIPLWSTTIVYNINMNFITSEKVTSVRDLFKNANIGAGSINVEGLNTSKVTDFSGMFEGVRAGRIYGLDKMNFESATNFSGMFKDTTLKCEEDDFLEWKVDKEDEVTDMFSGTKGLEVLNITDKWDRSRRGEATGASAEVIFNCDFGDLDEFKPTKNVSVEYKSFWHAFYEAADVSGLINRNEITKIVFTNTKREDGKKFTISGAGSYVENGKTIDVGLTFYLVGTELYAYIPEVVTASLNSLNCAFHKFTNLEEIVGLDMFDTSNMTDATMAFEGCEKLTKIGGLYELDTKNVTNMSYMFAGCGSLEYLDLQYFDTSKVTSMSGMFSNLSNVRDINLVSFDTSKVTDMEEMFWRAEKLTSLDVSIFDTANVTNMARMFGGCASLTEIDLSSFDTNKVVNMRDMFWQCTGLYKIYVSELWNTENVTDYERIFEDATKLKGGNGTKYDAKCGSDIDYARIDGKGGKDGLLSLKKSGSELEEVDQRTYIKDVKMAVEFSKDAAIKKLQDAGYVVVEKNLNEGSWGRYVYLGYTLTTDEDEAITSIGERWFSSAKNIASYVGDKLKYNYVAITDLNGKQWNTNEGAYGKYVYMYVSRDKAAGAAIESIEVLVENVTKKIGDLEGNNYTVVVNSNNGELADFNRGTIGKKVYVRFGRNIENVEVNEEKTYIKEVKMAVEFSKDAAINKLKDAGYTVVETNLNEGTSGRYIYIGYKTTNDETEAIRGIGERWFNADGRNQSTYVGNYHNYTYQAVTDLNGKQWSTNHGAFDGSRWVYLYTTSNANAGKPVTSIEVVSKGAVTPVAALTENGKYTVVVNSNDNGLADFNRGNRSQSRIYIRYQ